ncbi:hypothetical protein [Paraconexibacter sp. AEG42_29]|uniref:hypothetical protein n=1 Tax=Paraconexibacter sp. AEG42_29 TaxID=2997339 RepID=UPI00339D5122
MRRVLSTSLYPALALLIAGAAAVSLGESREQLPAIPWALTDISADARTVTILHEDPHCGGHAGKPLVREGGAAVSIGVMYVRDAPPDATIACTSDLRVTRDRVTLSRPLGSRRLQQPAVADDDGAWRSFVGSGEPRLCRRLLRLELSAGVFRTRWGRAKLRRCRAPVLDSVLRLPIMRRAPSAADRGRSPSDLADQDVQFEVLRDDLVRGVRRPARLWVIPGPRITCVQVRGRRGEPVQQRCDQSARVGKRGLTVVSPCDGGSDGLVRVAGIVPAGVRRVQMRRHNRVVASGVVRDGVFRVAGRRPDSVTLGRVRFAIGRAIADCGP